MTKSPHNLLFNFYPNPLIFSLTEQAIFLLFQTFLTLCFLPLCVFFILPVFPSGSFKCSLCVVFPLLYICSPLTILKQSCLHVSVTFLITWLFGVLLKDEKREINIEIGKKNGKVNIKKTLRNGEE